MTLRIDDREANHPAHQAFIDGLRQEVEVVVERLEFGDYAWESSEGETHGLELCTISDLLGKRDSGRLGFQAAGLVDTYDRRYWVTQGREHIFGGELLLKDRYGNIQRRVGLAGYRGIGFALERAGIFPLATDTSIATQRAILDRYRYARGGPHKLIRRTGPIPARIGDVSPHTWMLMHGPLGEQQADAARSLLGSVRDVVNAPVSELMAVPGIGKKTAVAWRQFCDDHS